MFVERAFVIVASRKVPLEIFAEFLVCIQVLHCQQACGHLTDKCEWKWNGDDSSIRVTNRIDSLNTTRRGECVECFLGKILKARMRQ